MSLTTHKQGREDEAPTETATAAQAAHAGDLRSGLAEALDVLQGVAGHSLADPGLTTLTPFSLDRLFVAARRQADRRQEGILLLLELMQRLQAAGTPADTVLAQRFVQQLHHEYRDQQRWHLLADNAAYYRDNRSVAERIAPWMRASCSA